MTIYLWGQRNLYGGGVHFSSFVDAMKRPNFFSGLVQEVNIQGQDLTDIVAQTTVQDIHILFFPLLEELPLKGAIIKWGMFEAEVLPDRYINYLSNSHLVWVPSHWARQVLVNHGLQKKKVQVIPLGVDPTLFHPFARDMIVRDNIFRFYMVGKKEERKGFSELLAGFKLAFNNDPNIRLYLKADNFWSDQVKKTNKNSEVMQEIEALDLTNVNPITGQMSTQDLYLLYNYCDAVAFPTRAEGWGLPLLEGIACGIPTITNFHSGQTEYLTAVKDKISCLNFKLEEIKCADFIASWGEGGSWAVASPETIAEAMIEMRENINTWRDRALAASAIVRVEYSWDKAVEKAICSLRDSDLLSMKINLQI